ncbi:MAG: cytochrome c [Oceanococcaceae bacterium]
MRAIAFFLLAGASAAASAADVEAGKVKFDTCMGCHGIESYTNAYPTYDVPRVAGQHAAYLEAALKAYRSRERNHPTMISQAASLSDEDIADIAAFLAQAGQ